MDFETQIALHIGRMYMQITQMQMEIERLNSELQKVTNGDSGPTTSAS